MTDRPDDTARNTTPERPNRRWRIPPRLFGRARTSTVILGICFVLTGLLYNQIESENNALQQGPMPIDPGLYEAPPQQSPQSEPTATTTQPATTTPTPSTTAEPSGTDRTFDETAPTPNESSESATQDPTYLPGRTIPPELRSLLPPAPPSPSGPPTQ